MFTPEHLRQLGGQSGVFLPASSMLILPDADHGSGNGRRGSRPHRSGCARRCISSSSSRFPHASCRENSSSTAPWFRGALPAGRMRTARKQRGLTVNRIFDPRRMDNVLKTHISWIAWVGKLNRSPICMTSSRKGPGADRSGCPDAKVLNLAVQSRARDSQADGSFAHIAVVAL